MEDTHAIKFVKNDEGGFEFAYFGIFDGHGGGEASKFARDHLLDEITKFECFWNDNDDDVLHAIKSGFLDVHLAMWREVGELSSRIYLVRGHVCLYTTHILYASTFFLFPCIRFRLCWNC